LLEIHWKLATYWTLTWLMDRFSRDLIDAYKIITGTESTQQDRFFRISTQQGD